MKLFRVCNADTMEALYAAPPPIPPIEIQSIVATETYETSIASYFERANECTFHDYQISDVLDFESN